MDKEMKLISLSEIELQEVEWLWYPYIPFGKITIIQGDPGEGKTTLGLRLAAACSNGHGFPGMEERAPISVIYQTAEDGLGDTVKPRLMEAEANENLIFNISEETDVLTLKDERIEAAIKATGAKLMIFDPIQGYVGEDTDINRANEIRTVMRGIARIAEETGCAIVFVGHLNKMKGTNSAYRGLGTIDFRASARSVLLVGRHRKTPNVRVIVHDKSSLIPILLAAYYGLRRSEVIGLKWSAIDFTENTLTVRHTVHSTEEGIVAKDRLKTKSSYRTLTLEPFVRGELLHHREKQEQMKKVMRSAYSKEYTDYVCVDALGKLYDPDFVTGHFGQLLKKHNLKKIRFHDLRHSCASVLLAQGVPMKQIQEWLGHSDMSTTANIYSHLDAVTKADTGAAMSKALG